MRLKLKIASISDCMLFGDQIFRCTLTDKIIRGTVSTKTSISGTFYIIIIIQFIYKRTSFINERVNIISYMALHIYKIGHCIYKINTDIAFISQPLHFDPAHAPCGAQCIFQNLKCRYPPSPCRGWDLGKCRYS